MFGRRRHSADATPAEPVDVEAHQADARSRVGTVSDETFFDLTAGAFTIVDFWAGWCGPCRAFKPVFEAAAAAHTGRVRFGACDIDASPRTAELLQIRSIPTLVVFAPDGSEIGRSLGAVTRGDLEATIRQLDARAGAGEAGA